MSNATNPLLRWPAVVVGMLSLSIGWGIRGNFGHDIGAMVPGVLCAVAVCLFSGREDWRRRVSFFAFFGAFGWGFGGTMSYMLTIGYTHSGHLATQSYGFFTVFVIGFLWAALGGAGTAYAAVADRERLTALFRPLCWILAVWAIEYFWRIPAARYNWIIFALIAGLYVWRDGMRSGAALLLHMAVGSGLAYLVFPVLLGIRLTPPRGDSWASVLGVFLGMLIYMRRNHPPVAAASLVAGVIGGLGFMVAQFAKILAYMVGNPVLTQDPAVVAAWKHWHSANWHSILTEQGVGLFYGLAIVLSMAMLSSRVKPAANEPRTRRWAEVFSVAFLLTALLYVNLVKNVADWTKARAVPALLKAPLFPKLEFSAWTWFSITFLLFTICVVALLVAHLRRPLALMPSSWLGRGQLFYILFLWAMVIGNFERALVSFHEQRLGTEWAIFVNALIATFMILYFTRESESVALEPKPYPVRRVLIGGFAAMAVFVALFTSVVHGVYGDRHDGWGRRNIRFGPDADWRVQGK